MQWIANITVLNASPFMHEDFSVYPIVADSEIAAARSAANLAADRLYKARGQTGYVSEIEVDNKPLYRAAIGVIVKGKLKGVSLNILIRPYRGK